MRFFPAFCQKQDEHTLLLIHSLP